MAHPSTFLWRNYSNHYPSPEAVDVVYHSDLHEKWDSDTGFNPAPARSLTGGEKWREMSRCAPATSHPIVW
ncbi:hypothetical protein J6590_009741 [Homalodisca vitripennis]|nr:hypothetical protein J6590_009741 [Homalodisca vitripennis]